MKKPKVGEWWMCEGNATKRICPMIKTPRGWGSISTPEGKPIRDFIQSDPDALTPLYKMVPEASAAL